MKLCRFTAAGSADVRVGLITNGQTLIDLTDAGVHRMKSLLERADLADELSRLSAAKLTTHALDSVRLLTPVESQEVWAAGVTYLRSREARMEESEFSASAYDRVYDAERPEIFFKSLPEKVVSPGEEVGIRRDARWNVPEPGQIKRPFAELVDYLFRSQTFPSGAVLLTGAGVVPPDSFTLEAHDAVRITISGIGTLENPVTIV